jgi:hypothetical protein
MFFERAYGLNGQKRADHDTLKQEMMALTGCSERAVHAVLYGSSYTDLLGTLRAQIPGYVAQKTSEMEDFTSLPFYHFDGNTATQPQPDVAAVPSALPSPSADSSVADATPPVASPTSPSPMSLSSPVTSHTIHAPVLSHSAPLLPSPTSLVPFPPSPAAVRPHLYQPVLIPASAVTLPDGSNLSMDEAVSKHYPALFLLALVAILPLTLLY